MANFPTIGVKLAICARFSHGSLPVCSSRLTRIIGVASDCAHFFSANMQKVKLIKSNSLDSHRRLQFGYGILEFRSPPHHTHTHFCPSTPLGTKYGTKSRCRATCNLPPNAVHWIPIRRPSALMQIMHAMPITILLTYSYSFFSGCAK